MFQLELFVYISFTLSLLGFSLTFNVKKLCQSSHFITLNFMLRYQNYVLVGGGRDAIRVQYTQKSNFLSLQKSEVRESIHRLLKVIGLGSLEV